MSKLTVIRMIAHTSHMCMKMLHARSHTRRLRAGYGYAHYRAGGYS